MINVAAHRIKQYGVEFYQASFSAREIDQLVRFEVLGYSGVPETKSARRAARTRVNWEVLESRIGESSDAYQRPVIRRKIEELVAYFRDCREAGKLPAIPGAVIITADKRLGFRAVPHHPDLGFLEIPEEPGVLRVLDGQHRLLALHALAAEGDLRGLDVPAVLFDTLDAQQIVELFVTINAKHTRLNPSHLVSLAGRKLYPDETQALAHDIIRALNEDETSPLQGEIKMLGIGRGPGGPGAARRGDRGAGGERREDGRARARQGAPRRRAPVLPELREGARADVPPRVGRAEVLDQDRHGAARVHPGGPGRDGPSPGAPGRSLRACGRSGRRSAPGPSAWGTAASSPTGSGGRSSRAARGGRWRPWPASSATRFGPSPRRGADRRARLRAWAGRPGSRGSSRQ